jgi:hypothetical protein
VSDGERFQALDAKPSIGALSRDPVAAQESPRQVSRPRSTGIPVADYKLMTLTADEREIISDLIGSVRTLAAHVMTLHLQLGAVRTLLARKGTITDAEVQAAFAELNVVASAEEVLDLTSTDAVFDELLERLNRAA